MKPIAILTLLSLAACGPKQPPAELIGARNAYANAEAMPVTQQYEAVGHAVRAVYTYSGMADVAVETHDVDYQSAVKSIWDNIVHRKYYLTGGVGSGDTAEGFGGDYVLGNDAYCESCSSCGLVFFEYKLNLAYHDARFADLYEETLYNALLGATDQDGKTFYYTNPLVGGRRTREGRRCVEPFHDGGSGRAVRCARGLRALAHQVRWGWA